MKEDMGFIHAISKFYKTYFREFEGIVYQVDQYFPKPVLLMSNPNASLRALAMVYTCVFRPL